MKRVRIEDLETAIAEILQEHGEVVYKATAEGLGAAEKVLIRNLKAKSPKDKGEFAKGWKATGRRAKLKRYVGNTKVVKGKKGDIPLSNILEYSTKSPHQGLIKRTYEESIPEMADAVVSEIRKEI